MNQQPKYVLGQFATIKVRHLVVTVQINKVRWSKSGQEYRYVVRDMIGRRVEEVPEGALRSMRTPGEKAVTGEIGRIVMVIGEDGKDVEGLRLSDGTLITL